MAWKRNEAERERGRGGERGRREIPFSLLRVVLSMVLLRTLAARVQARFKVMLFT
jgi:hypothetical protein